MQPTDWQYRSLGRTGVQISPLCLGTFNFGGPTPVAEALMMIDQALDAGINFIDTADYYNGGESERVVGQALAGGKRQQVVLATKVHFPTSDDPNDRGNSRRHIIQAVEASLRRLQTDWIDLYQIHRPDFDIPQDETLRALDDLVRQGKVRYIGTSTFPAWLLMEALAGSERHRLARYVSEQPPYNLLDRRIENQMVPLAQRHGLGLLTWSPLAMGILAGRYQQSGQYPAGSRGDSGLWYYTERITPAGITAAGEIAKVAAEAGLTAAELALAWVKDQPGISAAIIGPRTPQHLAAALPVLQITLSDETRQQLDQIVPPGGAVCNFFNNSGWMLS